MKKAVNICRFNRITSMILIFMLVFGIMAPSISFGAERAASVNASSLNIRSGPGTTYSAVAKLTQGAGVTVISESTGSDGKLWYQLRFNQGGKDLTGYALSSYIKFPVSYSTDGSFESYLTSQGFPESYKTALRQLHSQYPNWVFTAQKTNLDWNTVIQNESVVGRNLVANSSISSWKSIADGAYNWDSSSWPGFDSSSWVAASEDIIRYYMDPRNFLDETYIFQFLLHSYDSTAHTVEGLQSLVSGTFLAGNSPSSAGGQGTSSTSPSGGNTDSGSTSGGPGVSGPGASGSSGSSSDGTPSGGTTSGGGVGSNVIGSQAPTLGGSSDVKLEGPTASISTNLKYLVAETENYGPGMNGGQPSGGTSDPGSTSASASAANGAPYTEIIMNAGKETGVNPYVIASMIIQEQGTNGTSGSISGNAYGYTGYYNYFNIEAYQSGSMTPVQRGLWYASQSGSYGRPWNTPEKSITGGAQFYGNTYVKAGQDTFYLKKFNVQGSNMYKHQYMTNIQGAASEGAKLSKAYSNALKQTALEFKIPVYTNMPDTACAKPTNDGSPNNKLSGLSVDGFNITPTFSKDTFSYDLIVARTVTSIYIQASPIDSKATVSGIGNIQLGSDNNEVKISVKAENGSVREYILRVVKQDSGQTGSGGSSTSGTDSTGPGSSQGPGAQNSESSSGTGPGGSNVIVVQ